MKYYNSDFGRECLYMPHTPMNAKKTYNKLVCLRERDMRNGLVEIKEVIRQAIL